MQVSAMGVSKEVMTAMGAGTEVLGQANADMNMSQIAQMVKEF